VECQARSPQEANADLPAPFFQAAEAKNEIESLMSGIGDAAKSFYKQFQHATSFCSCVGELKHNYLLEMINKVI